MAATSRLGWRTLEADEAAALAVDGLAPRVACRPTSFEQAAEAVAEALSGKLAVLPRGAGTGMSLGYPPERADAVLDTTALDRLVDYAPADLTVTVQAGMSIWQLQSILRAEGQFLPLDPPGPPEATLGGIIATNASGPLRFGYGTARDLVIGTCVVNADGRLARAGGRVVKNVAGYDLNKLYVGSLGTLGVVLELSFKVTPLPERFDTLVAVFDEPENAARAAGAMAASPLRPLSLDALGAIASSLVGLDVPADALALLVRVGGFATAVERQLGDLESLCAAHSGRILSLTQDETEMWGSVRGLAFASDTQVLARASVPPAEGVAALSLLLDLGKQRGLALVGVARAASGVAYTRLDCGHGADLAAAVAFLEEARRLIRARGGSLVLEAAPVAVKQRFDVWGDLGPRVGVMQRLKQQFDPERLFNPGRFVGRL